MGKVDHLIIGDGAAGMFAAQEIRGLQPDASILIVGDEPDCYYYRASMSEWLSGEITDEMLPGRTEQYYEAMDLPRLQGYVKRVDPAKREVILADGSRMGYGELLIATGAQANRFPIPGAEEALVFRTLADVRLIKERLGCCGSALILGGGILGLELAGALHKMGIEQIAIVQRSAFVGKPLLDQTSAEWLQTRMGADGIMLYLNDTIEQVERTVDGERVAVMASGRRQAYDVLVQAVGITPVFPAVEGVEVGKGIRIDNRGRTNLPHIYAAGDCTETWNPARARWEPTRIWPHCAQQGRIAGRNMAGDGNAVLDLSDFNASLIYTIFYAYMGDPHGAGGQRYVWQTDGGYRLFRVLDGKLMGVLLLGERQGMMPILKLMGSDVGQYGADIVDPAFDYNALTGKDWDFLFW